MKNLIDLLSKALNEKGNRTVPQGTCVLDCPADISPLGMIPATFSMEPLETSSKEEIVGVGKWGGDVGYSDWPYNVGTLRDENGQPVVLTCTRDNVDYQVEIIVRAKGNVLGGIALPFWAVFEAVNEADADNVHNVFWVIPQLKTLYIKELELLIAENMGEK